uniref:Os01g0778700 protein n=1 Tax=Macrostomum lignano TaxID=282301 RepID=A0A1I8F5D1_9PLAT
RRLRRLRPAVGSEFLEPEFTEFDLPPFFAAPRRRRPPGASAGAVDAAFVKFVAASVLFRMIRWARTWTCRPRPPAAATAGCATCSPCASARAPGGAHAAAALRTPATPSCPDVGKLLTELAKLRKIVGMFTDSQVTGWSSRTCDC